MNDGPAHRALTPGRPLGRPAHAQAARRRALRLLGAVLPGVPQLVAGRTGRGVALALPWLALLGLAVWRAERVAAFVAAGPADGRVAVLVLAVGLGAVWILAQRDLARGVQPLALGGRSGWTLVARAFRRNRLAVAGLAAMAALYAVALLTPLLAPYDPVRHGDLMAERLLAPSSAHWLGTDKFGRDVLSRILYGARISLSIGFVAVAISLTIGTLVGAISGYLGDRTDAVIMRFVDMVISFPPLVLLITIVAFFQPSIFLIVAVLGLTQWPGTARIVRAEVLSLKEREFVLAARALGYSHARIVLRHLIPNALAPVIVTATLGIGNVIVLEAGLSFLGLGVQPPTPSWGSMVADGRDYLVAAWWLSTFPGLAIVLTVLSFNLVGDGLRDALDPRLRA